DRRRSMRFPQPGLRRSPPGAGGEQARNCEKHCAPRRCRCERLDGAHAGCGERRRVPASAAMAAAAARMASAPRAAYGRPARRRGGVLRGGSVAGEREGAMRDVRQPGAKRLVLGAGLLIAIGFVRPAAARAAEKGDAATIAVVEDSAKWESGYGAKF